MSKNNFASAYAASKRKKVEPTYPEHEQMLDDNDEFLSGLSDAEELPDQDSELFVPEAEIESPLRRLRRGRI